MIEIEIVRQILVTNSFDLNLICFPKFLDLEEYLDIQMYALVCGIGLAVCRVHF